MPLVVAARWRGFPLRRRADGPGLLAEALSQAGVNGWRHYFYGGTPEVLEKLRAQIQARWPDAVLVGQDAPPFRPLTPEEEAAAIARIHAARPDVLWVGLGCPKQERWMLAHSGRLGVPVMLGVGQAFDILAGTKKRAPGWMCNAGLEWLYRLAHEPRRLWKRYLLYNPWFVCLLLKEQAVWYQDHNHA
jgi:N-acetylglucosaminyldiphosphoundecaprenol N-acetyl-beta-D-mannosaminyltransferase